MKKVLFFILISFKSYSQNIDTICKGITVEIDKFESDTTYLTNEVDNIFMFKHKDSTLNFIAICFQATGFVPYYNEKGIYVLFKSGKKIILPEAQIKTRIDRYGNYAHSGTFTLQKEHIELILNDEITDFRLHKEDRKVNNSKLLRNYLKCLLLK